MSGPDERDLVIDLPTSLSCSILSDWVSTVDLARLDSAYCCQEKRGVVLDMLQSKEFLSTDDMQLYEMYHVSSLYWDWILRRDIKLFNITVDAAGADAEKLESYAERHERYIGHLDLRFVKSSSFALHCKHLVQLTCDVKVTPECRTLLLNNPTLQVLGLLGLISGHAEWFENVSLPCLVQLQLDPDHYSSELVAAALGMPASLLKLELLNACTDLTGIVKLCPYLRSLSLRAGAFGDELELAVFTSHLLHLVNLQLTNFIELVDSELFNIVKDLTQLRFLKMEFWNECNLTDTGVGHIAEHCAATLEVFSLGIYDLNTHITHASLDLLRARCTNLHQFHVEAPFLWPHIPFASVTTLLVEDTCTDDSLIEMSNECPQLQVLQLWGGATDCTLLVLRALCQNCSKLHRIEVYFNSIAFAYIKSLAATLPHLIVTDSSDDDSSLDVMKMPI